MCLGFAGRAGVNRKRMHAPRKFRRKNLVDDAMSFDPALSAEGFRYDINSEMRLTARPVSRVSFVAVRFILDLEALRRQRGCQFLGDLVLDLHDVLRK